MVRHELALSCAKKVVDSWVCVPTVCLFDDSNKPAA